MIYYCSTANCQSFIGKVVDSETKQPIPFASIKIEVGNWVYTNEEGVFNILENNLSEKISISSIGYESKDFSITPDFIKKDSVSLFYLTPKIYQLNPVDIFSSSKSKSVELGYVKNKKWSLEIFRNTGIHGAEYAVFIPNNCCFNSYIESLNYRFGKTSSFKSYIRLHIYSVNPITSKPDLELLKKDVSRRIKSGGIHEISVIDQHILFPAEGVFVGIEYIVLTDIETGYPIISREGFEPKTYSTRDLNEPFTWFRYADKEWSLTTSGIKKSQNPENLMFGISVIEIDE